VIVLVTGLTLGLSNGIRTSDVGGSVGNMLVAALVQLPAVWAVIALSVLFGFLPKFAAAAWAIASLALLISLFGPVVNARKPCSTFRRSPTPRNSRARCSRRPRWSGSS
jgi:ABC-2 type transport system permease protein